MHEPVFGRGGIGGRSQLAASHNHMTFFADRGARLGGGGGAGGRLGSPRCAAACNVQNPGFDVILSVVLMIRHVKAII